MAKRLSRVKSGKPIRSNRPGWTKRNGIWEKVPKDEQGTSRKVPK